jgi:soluble lytic murein transglycosylase-like protein
MKLAATALIMGCVAAAAAVVVQFVYFDNLPAPVVLGQPVIRQATFFIWQPFTHVLHEVHDAQRAATDVATQPEAKPALPKEEAFRLIGLAAAKHNVPPAFVKSIVAVESNFDPNVVSPKGAIGLMQLMPATAHEYGADPTIPEQNIDAGTHYLRVLMDRYSRNRSSLQRVIAAYNAGPAMVDRYRGIPPFRETRHYVARVLGFLRHFQRHPESNG